MGTSVGDQFHYPGGIRFHIQKNRNSSNKQNSSEEGHSHYKERAKNEVELSVG